MSEHVCFVYSSESVNGTNAGRKSLPEDKGPDVPADASSSKDKAPEPSLQSPYTANSTAKVIIPNKNLYPCYNPFAPIGEKKLKELADWLKIIIEHLSRKNHVQVELGGITSSRPPYLGWRTVHLVSLLRRGRRLPVNYTDNHWIAMWISIPKRHMVVWDIICSSIYPEELDVVMEPFLYMVSYLLVECASSDEQRAQYSLEPFTYERLTNIPPARAGDCGVYALNKKDFAKRQREDYEG
ncbi:BnaC06g16050D [Brassica napus]|uniref:BnaC06g16050D protein n=1 Tax=Brassica napus TaxID=3708 RepID=A0A078H3J6_BRANA|nr:BnaC06g16050D [Brassica napus]